MEQLDAVWTEQIRCIQWFSRLTDREGRKWEVLSGDCPVVNAERHRSRADRPD